MDGSRTAGNTAPSFTSSAAFDAAENQTAAGTVVAADSDADDSVTGYAIAGGADEALFEIDASTGELTFKSAPDFEDPGDSGTDNVHEVTVRATSGAGTRVMTADQTIAVTVTNVDEGQSGTVTIDDTAPMVGDELTASTANAADPDGLPDPFAPTWQWYRTPDGGSETEISGETSATYTVVAADLGATLTAKASWTDTGGFANTLSSAATSAVAAASALPTLSVGNASATEGADISFPLTLSAAASANVTVTCTASFETGDTAAAGDLSTTTGPTTIGAGLTSGLCEVRAAQDSTDEDDETFTVTLSGVSSNAQLAADPTAKGTIEDDDDLPTVSVGDVSGEEGTALTFTVALSAASGKTVTVDWAASAESGDTATAGTDFTAVAATTLTFDAGQEEKTVTVQTMEDSAAENDETFTVTLSSPSNATIPDATAKGTIEDDDGTTLPTLSVENSLGTEGSIIDFPLTLSAAASADVTVTCTASIESGDTAAAADLSSNTSGTATITASGTSGRCSIRTVQDTIDEEDETFTVTLSNVSSNAQLATDPTAKGTIVDDDTAPTITDVSVTSTPVLATGTYGAGETIEVSVTFDEAVTATSATDFELNVSDDKSAPLLRGSGTQTLVFGYTVAPGDADDNGIWIGDQDRTLVGDRRLTTQAGAITSTATGTAADLTHTELGRQDNHKVDGTRSIVSVAVTSTPQLETDTYGAGETIEFTVTFNVAVDVTGDPVFEFALDGGASRSAAYETGGGSTALVFHYLVVSGDTDANGIFLWDEADFDNPDGPVRLDSNDEIEFKDTSTDVPLYWAGRGTQSGHKVDGSRTTDNVAPVFTSSATFDAAENQTSAGTVVAADSDADDSVTGYEITGGADMDLFEIGATSGALTFKTAPDFEDPNTDNVHEVTVQATSGTGTRVMTEDQTITVTVTDVAEQSAKPDKPKLEAVSGSSTSLTATWEAPDKNGGPAITGYDLQYRAAPAGTWMDFAHTGTAVTTTVTGLTADTSYQVQVRAKNGETPSDWSDPSDAVSTNAAGATCTDNDIELTHGSGSGNAWEGDVLICHNDQQRAVCDDGLKASSVITANGWAFAGVVCRQLGHATGTPTTGSQYSQLFPDDFWLDDVACTGSEANLGACTHRGWGTENCRGSEAAGVQCTVAATGLAATGGDGEVDLAWDAPGADPGITRHEYRYKAAGGTYPAAWTAVPDSAAGEANQASYTVTGLAAGTGYDFELRIVGGSNESGADAASARTAGVAAPTNFTATAGDAQVGLSWDAPATGSGVTKHQYRQKTTGSYGSWTDIPNSAEDGANEASHTVTGLTNDTAYTFELRAVKDSTNSDEVEDGPVTPMAVTPGTCTLDTAAGDIWCGVLTVGAVSSSQDGFFGSTGGLTDTTFSVGSSNYMIEQLTVNNSTSTNAGDLLLGLGRDRVLSAANRDRLVLHVDDSGDMFAFNATAASGFSLLWTGTDLDWSSATTVTLRLRLTPEVPGKPTNLMAEADGSTRIALSWDAPADDGGSAITGYRIEVSDDGGSNWSELEADTGDDGTSYTHEGLSPGDTRHYRVSAINAEGTSDASDSDSATTVAAGTCALNPGDLWCGVVTVADLGSGADGFGSTGGLSDTTFSVGGRNYTIRQVSVGNSTSASPGTLLFSLHSVLDAADQARLELHVDGSGDTFAFSAIAGVGSSFIWRGTSLDWSSATTVTLRLRLTPQAPDKPTNLMAEADGSTRIDLSWTAPADDGGSAITGYRIEVSPDGSSDWDDLVADTGNDATSYTHEGLSAGDTRHYRVSAINAEGMSDASDSDSATTMPEDPAADASLSALTVSRSGGVTVPLHPDFASDETDYAASVANAVDEVTVAATATVAGAMLEYLDGDGNALPDTDTNTPGREVALDVGEETLVQVKVTAEDTTTTRTYTVTVTRRAPDAPGVEGEWRLMDMKPSTEGGVTARAEVFHAGRWGTVCSDGIEREKAFGLPGTMRDGNFVVDDVGNVIGAQPVSATGPTTRRPP